MKKLILTSLLLTGTFLFSQTVDSNGNLQTNSQQYLKGISSKERLQGWYVSGNNSLQFNQAAFSNWVAGGINSYSLTANVDYEFNLTHGKHIWDNRILLNYGVMRNEGEEYRKSNDVIDLNSSYGYEFAKNFYFAAALNFKTQFSEGFDYDVKDSVTGKFKKISNIMAPGYFSFGLGVDYKPNENLQVNFHPFTSRFTFVTDKDLQYAGSFGLKEDGDTYLYEFGAFLGARYKFQIMENITYDNKLGIYSNYLNHPFNMDVAYQGVLDLKVNNFISAQATINLFYDEDQIKKTQLKQTLGVGLAYKFNNSAKLKEWPENMPKVELTPEAEEKVEAADAAVEVAKEAAEAAAQAVEEATQAVEESVK